MFESLSTWAAPYGGLPFLYLTFLALASLIALFCFKQRLSTFTLKRFIRLGALIALPLTVIATEMGGNNWGLAVVAIVWAILVAILCHTEASQRTAPKK